MLLFLKSSSGRIPAGSVSISLNSVGQSSNRSSHLVDKCPDKQAVIEMGVSCECLNEIDCVPLNPPTHRSNQSDHETRISFGNNRRRTTADRSKKKIEGSNEGHSNADRDR